VRRSALFVCSTIHLPVPERRAIDRLIAEAPRADDGRVKVDHPGLVIEPYAYGFFVHTGAVGCGGGDGPDISLELRTILAHAFDHDASWVLFDRDEPVSPDFSVFPDPNNPEEHQS
jgi:hypothetical protein